MGCTHSTKVENHETDEFTIDHEEIMYGHRRLFHADACKLMSTLYITDYNSKFTIIDNTQIEDKSGFTTMACTCVATYTDLADGINIKTTNQDSANDSQQLQLQLSHENDSCVNTNNQTYCIRLYKNISRAGKYPKDVFAYFVELETLSYLNATVNNMHDDYSYNNNCSDYIPKLIAH